uniref:Macaca fascicularis brain cDNA clone: QtrA-16537, similar to human methionyl-tRNA formyltransferase, mitochondrial (MtFMT), mRNA, RefSeq: NM_139242.2 n=1 Tax=Macaca fascicularis TaxID=9541 RepID=I7GJC8_MACFA|nr:unnamed protein product [Macaca fascicularis]
MIKGSFWRDELNSVGFRSHCTPRNFYLTTNSHLLGQRCPLSLRLGLLPPGNLPEVEGQEVTFMS